MKNGKTKKDYLRGGIILVVLGALIFLMPIIIASLGESKEGAFEDMLPFLILLGIIGIGLAIPGIVFLVKSKNAPEADNSTPKDKKGMIFGLIIAIIAACALLGLLFPKEPSKWDKLSDEEKQWYHDNYGDGKMDDINDAIKNYGGY